MGMEFYNLQIKKNGNDIKSKIKAFIESKGYSLTDKENAIGSIAVLNNPNCDWIAISSDFFIFHPENCHSIFGKEVSELFNSEVLNIAYFDDEYLLLNLIDKDYDGWISTGMCEMYRINRESDYFVDRVSDTSAIKNIMLDNKLDVYEKLNRFSNIIEIPFEQCCFSYNSDIDNCEIYYFKGVKSDNSTEENLPQFCMNSARQVTPCRIDAPNMIVFNNIGKKTTGVKVMFSGKCIKNKDVIITDVRISGNKTDVPISLEYIENEGYYIGEVPTLEIPEKMPDDIPVFSKKYMTEVFARNINVHFYVKGNSRRVLDIEVTLIPDENPDGSFSWCCWKSFNSPVEYLYHLTMDERVSQKYMFCGTIEITEQMMMEAMNDEKYSYIDYRKDYDIDY